MSLPHDEVRGYINSCDVGLLLRRDHIVNKVSSPTKFAEFLACGLPVLTTPWAGNSENIIDTYNVGYVWDMAAISDKLISLLIDVREHRDVWARRCTESTKLSSILGSI